MQGRPGNFLVTDRLSLRTWEPGDEVLVRALHSDPDVNRYLSQENAPWSDRRVVRRLAQWAAEWEADGLTKFKLLRRTDNVFIGRAGFSRLPESGEFELGYSIARQYWGNGYASEAAIALALRFFEVSDMNSFVAFAHAENVASQRVLEKAGMRFERAGPYHDMPFRFYRMDRPRSGGE
ncbi:MAG TPA: GNAT family N-acetyltransferase [Mesorhizobium sp.]